MRAVKESRREFFLQMLAGLLVGPSLASAAPTALQAEVKRRIARLFEEYDGQGIHRTGAAGDKRSADWLVAEVSKLGVKPVLEPFALELVDPQNCFVEIDARRIEGCRPLTRHLQMRAACAASLVCLAVSQSLV